MSHIYNLIYPSVHMYAYMHTLLGTYAFVFLFVYLHRHACTYTSFCICAFTRIDSYLCVSVCVDALI